MTTTDRPHERLRIITFNVFPDGYRLVANWAVRHNHTVALRRDDTRATGTTQPALP